MVKKRDERNQVKAIVKKMRSLHSVNAHVESLFNAELANVIVFQLPARHLFEEGGLQMCSRYKANITNEFCGDTRA